MVLEALVRMKLNSFLDKDRTHLRALIAIFLWERAGARVQGIRYRPGARAARFMPSRLAFL